MLITSMLPLALLPSPTVSSLPCPTVARARLTHIAFRATSITSRHSTHIATTLCQLPLQGVYRQTHSSPTQMAAQPSDAAQAASSPADPVVQYLVLRKDLWTDMKWPLGSVVAQACHASTAAMFSFFDDEITANYVAPENINSMHKVVLEVKGESQLRTLSAKLDEAGVKHKLWVEQPEDFPTCLATKPYHKSEVAQHFKKFQLCKAALSS